MALPVTPFSAADTVVWPVATAVARPDESMVATEVLPTDHVTALVILAVELSL